MTSIIQQRKEINILNKAAIIDAMPDTNKGLAYKTGICVGTVQDIVRKMRKSGDVVVVGETSRKGMLKGGCPIAIYGWAEETHSRRKKKVVVPVTKYHTQWIGGMHPCATEQDAYSIIRQKLIAGVGQREAVAGTKYSRAVARRLQSEMNICKQRGGYRGVNPPLRMAA